QQQSHPIHLRSCVLCRQRKVKCDRQQPCSHCTRSGNDCVYPSGRGRAPKRPRRDVEEQLAEKLSRLETIIKRLASENASQANALSARQTDSPPTPGPSRPADDAGSNTASSLDRSSSPGLSSIEGQLNRLVIDPKKSYYVSNPLWASLASEIDELREIITQPEEEVEEDTVPAWTEVPPVNDSMNAALFGYRSTAYSLKPYHPLLPQALDIYSAFAENVAPLLRFFHMPTLAELYRESISSTTPLERNTEALIFAIYYSGIMSMPPDQCMNLLGLSQPAALERYRFATEQAIARADLLNTQSIVLLQAVALFLSALRCQTDSRASWSLNTLIFHLAQAMGLHRDGTIFGLNPFDTEIRRRLWWHICVLDSRSSEYHGFGPIMYQSTFDTRIPLNVNDTDLWPGMTEPPRERDEATDMTFSLIRCEAMRTAVKARLLSPDMPSWQGSMGGKPEVSARERVQLLQELQKRLKDHYLPLCDTSSPILLLASLLAKLIFVHFHLVANPDHAVSSSRPETDLPDVMSRDQLFESAIGILELSGQILSLPGTRKWVWYAKSHVQWHVVAFVLAEICRRPPSEQCERAWACVTKMYDAWNMHNSASQGLMRKSVRRLLVKAKHVRQLQ
ncbi:hypothetical protein M406DRAFT_227231, partial [Cryphonectria parasitica EP155]